MESSIDLTKLRIERLSERNSHTTESFDCGVQDLNEFIKEDALKHQKEKIAMTYLCFHGNDLVGYFTWLTDAIEIKGDDKKVFETMDMGYRTYPAIKIGRMAIDKRYSGRGIGKFLVKIVISNVLLFSKYIGCRFVTVDAYPNAKDFYKKIDFGIHSERKSTIFMYIDIKRFAKD